MRTVLQRLGFQEARRDDSSAWNFVLADADENKIDVHVIVFDTHGNGVLGPAELGQFYPAGALGGAGEINGAAVRCVAPEFMVRFKTRYEPREIDRLDVAALRDRFGI